MSSVDFILLIADQLRIAPHQVSATIALILDGCTTPFIARYRKELTHGLDEVQIEGIRSLHSKYTELSKRKLTILETIKAQGKWTEVLEQSIQKCWEANVLEDLYLPYKPKRKTKASIAREKGLEPFALWLLDEPQSNPYHEATRYFNQEVSSVEEALQGARDIIADIINEDPRARSLIRNQFAKYAVIHSRIAKNQESEGEKYKDYFKYAESLQRCPSHRLLAMYRGEDEGYLKLSIEPDEVISIQKLQRSVLRRNNACSTQVQTAIHDAYKRLLAPSMESEFRNLAKAKADEEAIKVFSENLKQLLLSPPLGSKRILAIDPGFRSGCKLVCLNEEGALVADDIIYPHEPQKEVKPAIRTVTHLVEKYRIEAIAIGNGTAGRETEDFIHQISFVQPVEIYMVNENGASIYSASEIAREEFPNKDLTVRGAVSIGRRLSDPLAELVKIEAKSIGVGQYQHDVDQTKLQQSLDTIVEHCVNQVGVNLNTASKSLLTYVSGLNVQTAQNIIHYREEHGAFTTRNQLKKVPRLGDKTFEQCAGFLRIPDAKNILDNTAVHPESYSIVEDMARQSQCSITELIQDESRRRNINPALFVTEKAGLPTIQDILNELVKPGRDPREHLKPFTFADVKKPEDLIPGMILPGIVTNITQFGCFVDLGVKQDGMVHISELADQFISDPNTVVKLNQHIQVRVLEVDLARKRIGLSMKGL